MGEILCHQLSLRDDVEKIIALDKEPQSDWCKNLSGVIYIQHNMADAGWEERVASHRPDVVIHTAWQIRALYGRASEQWHSNVHGSDRVFDFSFSEPSVQRLIYFSTAASYSARKENRFDHLFTEEEGFRADDYIYAHEKKVTEDNLKNKFDTLKASEARLPQVSVVRPAAITGPRGRFARIRFGLQSALAGNLPSGSINRLVTLLTAWLPVTKGWVRQFIHEDDVSDIVMTLAFDTHDWDYNVFNITPTSTPVYASDMAVAVGKRILSIKPGMARLAFWFFWHMTRGRIPTCPGSWRFYSYPIVMSGEKLTQIYQCKYSCLDAITYTDGRYADLVPASHQNLKPIT